MSKKFQGIYTALVTPFDEQGQFDADAYDRLIQQQLDAGIHGLVPCGTTGETPTLSPSSKLRSFKNAFYLRTVACRSLQEAVVTIPAKFLHFIGN